MVSPVGLVFSWFASLLRGFFFRFLRFSFFHKNQHSKFQFDLVTVDKKSHLVEYPLLTSHYYCYRYRYHYHSHYYYYYYYLSNLILPQAEAARTLAASQNVPSNFKDLIQNLVSLLGPFRPFIPSCS